MEGDSMYNVMHLSQRDEKSLTITSSFISLKAGGKKISQSISSSDMSNIMRERLEIYIVA